MFIQSLNSWKKRCSLPNNLSDLENVWKIEFFSKLQQVFYKCFFCRFCQILLNLAHTFVSWKKALFPRFLRSLLITYLIAGSLEIEIIVLEKKAWKKSWILDPKICTRVRSLEKSLNFRGCPWNVLKFLCKSLKSPWILFNFECSGLERVFWCFLVVQDRI